MGSRPCGRCCCPWAAPRGWAVPPCASATPTGATALAVGLPTPAGVAPVGASHARGRPRMLEVAPTSGFGHGQLPPYRGPRPQSVAPCSRPGRGWPALHGGWPPLRLAAFAVKTQQERVE
ncbi:hypothetical protein BHM03_00044973 [Ensete ventricosum]|nr:hypothetical protein BHM03_00044973 [Ensete ventricosum]